jgi:hypothetical protein
LWISVWSSGKSSEPIRVGEGSDDAGVAEGVEGVEEGVMFELNQFEEGGVVAEVPISLRVGTFGDCEEGGSLRSHVVICKESLYGSRNITKSRGICSG